MFKSKRRPIVTPRSEHHSLEEAADDSPDPQSAMEENEMHTHLSQLLGGIAKAIERTHLLIKRRT